MDSLTTNVTRRLLPGREGQPPSCGRPASRGIAALLLLFLLLLLLPFLSLPEPGSAWAAAAMEYLTGPPAPTQGNM